MSRHMHTLSITQKAGSNAHICTSEPAWSLNLKAARHRLQLLRALL